MQVWPMGSVKYVSQAFVCRLRFHGSYWTHMGDGRGTLAKVGLGSLMGYIHSAAMATLGSKYPGRAVSIAESVQ